MKPSNFERCLPLLQMHTSGLLDISHQCSLWVSFELHIHSQCHVCCWQNLFWSSIPLCEGRSTFVHHIKWWTCLVGEWVVTVDWDLTKDISEFVHQFKECTFLQISHVVWWRSLIHSSNLAAPNLLPPAKPDSSLAYRTVQKRSILYGWLLLSSLVGAESSARTNASQIAHRVTALWTATIGWLFWYL